MSIRKKNIEELELMSYTDIAYEIIKEDKKKKYNTPNLFKEVCKLLKLSDEEFAEKIADFFTALTTDGRFILIDSTIWDLKENHSVKVVVDDGDEEEIESDDNFCYKCGHWTAKGYSFLNDESNIEAITTGATFKQNNRISFKNNLL